ncbi:MAG: peptidoglycan-binding domain-containing protein [Holophagales bacterium]|nr:peptidoglycan-binding domain-containing protein [Holophagales bacterium]
MSARLGHEWRIPLEEGQAVSRGWPEITGGRPLGVTWHWTATADLATCNRLLGGARAERKGQASAHFAVGRSFREGAEQYVSLEDRSWHAGRNQTLRWDARPLTSEHEKGSRVAVGVETVALGYARAGLPAGEDWIAAHSVDGRWALRVQPWPPEQVEMMAEIGRHIVARWSDIGPRDHHGHHDLCPGYKVDVAGFPFVEVLRRIYGDPEIPDVWSATWTIEGRRRALLGLGYRPGEGRGPWGPADDAALRRFQVDRGFEPDGLWTTAMAWQAHDAANGS